MIDRRKLLHTPAAIALPGFASLAPLDRTAEALELFNSLPPGDQVLIIVLARRLQSGPALNLFAAEARNPDGA